VLAFEHFGSVPGRIRYDNLKPAVVRVLRGRDRVESERFIALRSHYPLTELASVAGVSSHARLLDLTAWRMRSTASGVTLR
jgi:hypothetical protein